ncbi:pyridoxamine 5'-phosphate oxidase-related, FMN-binding protein [Paraglaciecola sp. T6c]|uniref:pyridoxamine 5'-phosphate oxidase family protein n=1 Tax=Pseudoalteromonas atlantica (strain T6c / ATCC BAA-1087) TaxID=3042615 RepID=UPI00005C5B07|nr:pyridoxamine 5'-phosphate oxidase family protein [Paraglaciecola sp. T6c]ABG42552.1 pyridoxamine 5'-phosphate oxidase-related, FMN-binding protein [Paraglaciecola sp. T6c]
MEHHSPWHAIFYQSLSAHEKIPASRYLQLATVDNQGNPRCRTLVFRGLNQDKNQLYLHTDNRSEKMSQLEIQKHVEACWYFSETREQFRFSGHIECIGQSEKSETTSGSPKAQHLRLAHWQKLSDALRESYGPNYDIAQPDENFVLLILHITRVDYLRLAPLPHLRVIYHLDASENWQAEAAVP